MMAKIISGDENSTQNNTNQSSREKRMPTVEKLVLELTIPEHSENSLLDLSKVLHILYIFYFETLIKYFSLKCISRVLPTKPYIKYFHCEILVVRLIALRNCGVSFIFDSFFVLGLIFLGILGLEN